MKFMGTRTGENNSEYNLCPDSYSRGIAMQILEAIKEKKPGLILSL